MKYTKFLIVSVGLILLSSIPAFALNQTFFGEDLGWYTSGNDTNSVAAEAAFLSNLTGVGTEDFESFLSGSTAPLTTDFGVAGTATLQGVGTVVDGVNAFRRAYSGSNYYETNTGNFTINFSDSIAAFGFFGIDIGDFSGQATVTLSNGELRTYNIGHTIGSSANGALLFWGIIDTDELFTSITIGNTGSSADWFGFDDFTIGTAEQVNPVPEPTTMLLLGAGLAGIAGMRKKFNKK